MSEQAERSGNGDEHIEAWAHLAAAGREALTDEMVTRLAATASQLAVLLDQVNQADLGRAMPTLQRLVDSGDLARVAALTRLLGAGEEALTDQMIARLAGAASEGLDLLDRLNWANLERLLPVLQRMADNGDLERMASLARLFGAAEEAVTDEMVGRLAGNATELLALADRLQSSGLLVRLIDAAPALDRLMSRLSPEALDRLSEELPRAVDTMDRLHQMRLVDDVAACVQGATEEVSAGPEAAGGWRGLLGLLRQKETQQALQFVAVVGKHFRRCRLARVKG